MVRPRTCFVCQHDESKYKCASCTANYCSLACYKRHKETCIPTSAPVTAIEPAQESHPEPLRDPTPLRPLTSLKWPYVPDTSAYPDPLQRDDPKPLQLHQYEAIATSPAIRTILTSNPRIRDLLTSIDALRGIERDEALQRALGVDSRLLQNAGTNSAAASIDEDTRAFRALAEAVEVAVRGGQKDTLGLDWD